MTVTTINIDPLKLAVYMEIAIKQRQRQADKFKQDYGPEMGKALDQELHTMKTAVASINQMDIEEVTNKKGR